MKLFRKCIPKIGDTKYAKRFAIFPKSIYNPYSYEKVIIWLEFYKIEYMYLDASLGIGWYKIGILFNDVVKIEDL